MRARSEIIRQSPLIAIEIMSPEDRLRNAAAKALEYIDFGIEKVWIIDPNQRLVYTGTEMGPELVHSAILNVPGTPIEVNLNALFSELDQMWATPAADALWPRIESTIQAFATSTSVE